MIDDGRDREGPPSSAAAAPSVPGTARSRRARVCPPWVSRYLDPVTVRAAPRNVSSATAVTISGLRSSTVGGVLFGHRSPTFRLRAPSLSALRISTARHRAAEHLAVASSLVLLDVSRRTRRRTQRATHHRRHLRSRDPSELQRRARQRCRGSTATRSSWAAREAAAVHMAEGGRGVGAGHAALRRGAMEARWPGCPVSSRQDAAEASRARRSLEFNPSHTGALVTLATISTSMTSPRERVPAHGARRARRRKPPSARTVAAWPSSAVTTSTSSTSRRSASAR